MVVQQEDWKGDLMIEIQKVYDAIAVLEDTTIETEQQARGMEDAVERLHDLTAKLDEQIETFLS